jgi:hypothetical protein
MATDNILKAFARFCDGGTVILSDADRCYLQHCAAKAQQRSGRIDGHPVFVLMAMERPGQVDQIIPFLKAAL